MKELSLSSVKADGFSILVSLDRGELRAKFVGNGGMDATPILGDYLKRLHAEACRLAVAEVVVDFSDLYFMNSSCFKCFASWLSTNMKLGAASYGVRFVTNAQLHWQKRSLEALQCFAPQLVQIEG